MMLPLTSPRGLEGQGARGERASLLEGACDGFLPQAAVAALLLLQLHLGRLPEGMGGGRGLRPAIHPQAGHCD